MKLGIMQPYFFPYIAYWQLINAVDRYVIYDDVNFIKGGWINRNRILMGGLAHNFNLPMQNSSSNKLINEVRVSDSPVLKRKMLTTLETCYRKAPFYNQVIPLLTKVIQNSETCLSKYITASIVEVCSYLGITTELIISSDIPKDNTLRAQDKVLDICHLLGATCYINAIGGMELYDRETFSKRNIDIKFLKSGDISYKQFKNEFVPNLSIIDVMMFNSPETIRKMLDDYTLV